MKRKKILKQLTALALFGSLVVSTAVPTAGMTEVKATETTDGNWEEIQSIIGRYYGEWNDTLYSGLISNTLPNTALLGNGDVGIASGGNADEKKFYISKGDFWTYRGNPLPIGGVTIKEQEKETDDKEKNLAPQYKEVTASNYYYYNGEIIFPPEDAVNGDMQQTPSGYGWVTDITQDPVWLQLEFENPITVARYVVKGDGAVREGYEQNNPSEFRLQYSDSGESDSWKDADIVTNNDESIYDKNLDKTFSAKYVRLYITKPLQAGNNDPNPRARIGQFELYSDPKAIEDVELDNLALNKKIKADMVYVDRLDRVFPAEEMVDGDESTKWCGLEPYPETEHTPTHWAIVDLGEMKNISYYKLIHSGIVGETEHNTVDYQLQYLPDIDDAEWDSIEEDYADAWVDMDKVTGNMQTMTTKTFDEPIRTRYVRLYITKAASGNTAARIHELELYEEAPSAFYEKQDILNAEIQTTQNLAGVPTEMKTWLSDNKNIMVTELTSKSMEDAEFQVETWASNNNSNNPITAENNDESVTITRSTVNNYREEENSYVSKAALSTKILGVEEVQASSDNESGKGILKFTLEAGDTVYIVTSVGGGGRTYHNDGNLWEGAVEPIEDAKKLLGEVSDKAAVTELNNVRQEWWKNFWSGSYIDFGTEDENLNKVQKYYYGAQYILGSTARKGEVAPGLYGIWHTTDTPNWYSDYHLNYNFMSTFYGTYSSNRPELTLPGIESLLDYMPVGQKNASSVEELRKINEDFVNQKIEKGDISEEDGIPGAILYPVGIGPWGMPIYPDSYHSELLDAAYNSYLMTQYYDYTVDKDFLESGVYDYMKQAVALYEAWLEKEETTENKDGYEYVLYAGFNEGSWAKNPAVELAALKNTLRHLISVSEVLGRDEDKRAEWIEIYEHLSDQPTTVVNGKTVLALGEKQWNGSSWVDLPSPIPGDGNALPLDAMIPGGVYNYFSSPEDLQMIQDTIDVFSQRGAWSQINNFPRLFPEAVKSRYPVDTVVTKLVDVINRQMAPNLRINDNTHGVEKCGSTETINSMMLISEEGITKIFPNWYTDKDAKFVNLRAKGAFTVSAEYDGAAQEAKNVVITSEVGEDMTLVSPWAEGMTVKDSEGNVVATTKGTVPNWEDQENATYTFSTTAGETYTVEKGETATEKPSKNTLEYFLNKAKEHQANGDVGNCVESIKNLFAEAIAEGEAVMADENATYDEVMDATVKLMKAIQALDMKAADKTDLEMAVELAQGIDLTKYVEAGQAEFQQALAAAQEVLADGDAMQADADAAWNALVDAISNLRLKADKSTLEDLLNSVADLDLSQYTEESAAVFRTALANAQAVLADESLTEDDQKTVDEAVQVLSDAKDQLQLKDASTGDGNDNTGDGSDNTGNGDSQTPGSGDNSGNNGNSGSNNAGNSNAGNSNAKADAPKTGDTAPIMGLILLGILSGAAILTISRKRVK